MGTVQVATSLGTDSGEENPKSGIVLRYQLGKFRLRLDLLQDNVVGMLQLFSKTIVIDAEVKIADGCVEYLGYSEYFHPLSIGDPVPDYVAVFGFRGLGKFLGFTPAEHAERRRQEVAVRETAQKALGR
jgi:hypothetical protein